MIVKVVCAPLLRPMLTVRENEHEIEKLLNSRVFLTLKDFYVILWIQLQQSQLVFNIYNSP
jgi:hypothetical protein